MSQEPLQQLLDDIKSYIAAGRMIEAIKLYRDATGAGLKEAKEAIELIAAGKPPKDHNMAPRLDEASMSHIEAAIRSGQKIEAIRLYREAANVDLKAAKDAVDALELRIAPEAAMTREAAMRRIRRMALIVFLIILGFTALILSLNRM